MYDGKNDSALLEQERSPNHEKNDRHIYRYAQAKGKGFTGVCVFLLDFPDPADISDWADEAIHWMVMHGLITGISDGTLAPKANATRAQIATMFMRFVAEMEK